MNTFNLMYINIVQKSLHKNHVNGRSGLHVDPKFTLILVSSLGCHLEMTLQ